MIHRKPSPARKIAQSLSAAVSWLLEDEDEDEVPPLTESNLDELFASLARSQCNFTFVMSRHASERLCYSPTPDQWRRNFKRRIRKKAHKPA